jgi:hypothetical protein
MISFGAFDQFYPTMTPLCNINNYLSLGLLNDNGSQIFDPTMLPWSISLRPSALKLMAEDLRAKVKRRVTAAGDKVHAPHASKCVDSCEVNRLVGDQPN